MSLTDTEGRELLISLSGVYYSPLCSTERTSVASAVRSSLRFVIPHQPDTPRPSLNYSGTEHPFGATSGSACHRPDPCRRASVLSIIPFAQRRRSIEAWELGVLADFSGFWQGCTCRRSRYEARDTAVSSVVPPGDEKVGGEGGSPSSGLASAALLMIVVTFGSAIIGAVRTVLFAWRFGAEGPASAFFQASRIPDLVYFLIAGGALRSGFVPVFAQYWAQGRREEAWRTFSALFWFLTLLGASVVAVGIGFAPQLSVLIGPGWAREHQQLVPLCAQLMRLMFPAQLFFVLGGLLMGTLNARKHFLWPGLGPILYNLVVVIAIAFATGPDDLPMVAAVVPVGAFIGNVLVQLPPIRRLGGRLQFIFDLRDEGLRKTLLLAMPIIFGLAIAEIEFLIMAILATVADPVSGPSTLVYANLIWRTPTRVFGGGISIALFPSLAYHFAEGATEKFRRDFSFAVRTALFMAAPVTVGLIALAEPIVSLLYQHGEFTEAAVEQVASTLIIFSLGIVPLTLYYLVARAFYARHDTATPVTVGLIGLALCASSGWLLMKPLGVPGLALGIALATALNTGLLWGILERRVGRLGTVQTAHMFLRLMIPLGALTAVCLAATHLTPGLGYGTMITHLLALAVGVVGGGSLYLGLASLMRFEELELATSVLRRRSGLLAREPGLEEERQDTPS